MGMDLNKLHTIINKEAEKLCRFTYEQQFMILKDRPLMKKDFYIGFSSGMDIACRLFYMHLESEGYDLSEDDRLVITTILKGIEKHYWNKDYETFDEKDAKQLVLRLLKGDKK